MTQLLVSVKDANEAKQAVESGADLIDLKDPEVGALGELNHAISVEVLDALKPFDDVKVSATVGDSHDDLATLLDLIEQKAHLGIHYVKLPYNENLLSEQFNQKLNQIKAQHNVQVIVVMNANRAIDWDMLIKLKHIGFYGAMLDTFDKQKNLISSIKRTEMIRFVNECKELGLFVGLAGSLNPNMVDSLVKLSPDYIGFRSGVCVGNVRKNKLLPETVKVIKAMLYNHNVTCAF